MWLRIAVGIVQRGGRERRQLGGGLVARGTQLVYVAPAADRRSVGVDRRFARA
jgi:hypothetical protein